MTTTIGEGERTLGRYGQWGFGARPCRSELRRAYGGVHVHDRRQRHSHRHWATAVKPKLSLVTLGVRDLNRSRRFYEALGWSPMQATDSVVFFELGGVVLGLYGWDDLALDADVDESGGGGFRGVSLAHNEPSPSDVDRAVSEFIAAGATIVKHPEPTEWGGYSGYIADPDGHLWEIAHNPFDDWT